MYRSFIPVLASLIFLVGCNAEPKGPPTAPSEKMAATKEAPKPTRPLPKPDTSNHDAAYEALNELLDVRERQHLIFCSPTDEGVEEIALFLETYPDSEHRERVLYLAALSRWDLYRYADAADAYRAYLAEFPKERRSSLAMTRCVQSLIRSDQPDAAIIAVDEFKNGPAADQRELHRADALALAGRPNDATSLVKAWIVRQNISGGNKRVIEVAGAQLKRLEMIGKPLPAFNKKAYGTKEALTPETFHGKVLLLDFCPSWCKPCMPQMPHLLEIYQSDHENGFDMLGISLDSDANRMEKTIARVGMNWPQYYDGKKWKNDLAVLFDVHRIPHTILVDRQGIVQAVDPPPQAVDRILTELLQENGPTS